MRRIKINQKKNEVILTFNENFYKKEFIQQAIIDFGQICAVKKDKESIILKPKKDLDIDILGYEFYNYVLGLMKNFP